MHRGRPSSRITGVTLPASPTSVRVARKQVITACRAGGVDDLAETGALLVSELVTNAITHAAGDVDLLVNCTNSRLVVGVSDGSTDPPVINHSPVPDQSGGRGLYLVDRLANRWDFEPTATGKTVWFTLET